VRREGKQVGRSVVGEWDTDWRGCEGEGGCATLRVGRTIDSPSLRELAIAIALKTRLLWTCCLEMIARLAFASSWKLFEVKPESGPLTQAVYGAIAAVPKTITIGVRATAHGSVF
jgi:hypothetical protein